MSEPASSLAFDDVVIDFAGRRLVRGGIAQPLEPKAFAVLALLAGTPGRAFARDEILDAVWGHRHVTPGVLNRVMTLLRHALGEDAHASRYLRTVHGVGYRFDLPHIAAADPEPAPSPPVAAPETGAMDVPHHRRGGSTALSIPARRSLRWLLLPLALLAFAGWALWPRPQPAPVAVAAVQERSIAVLPLVNASGDAEQQFFSDGLSENLIDTLSKSPGLKVIGRISSFGLRDTRDDSRTIGAKLDVAYLVSGSVQRAGDSVRIGAELIDAADGRTLWTEHYDRPYRDLFALQDEIAQAIARALHAKLLPHDAATQSDRPPGGSIEAYTAYLQGLQSFYRLDYRKAVERQDTAVQLDPDYAAAWAQLSVAWAHVGQFTADSEEESRAAFHRSREAVDTALRLAPDLGLAHGALGNLLLASDMDWQGAVAEFARGLQLAPDNGQNQGGFSRALAATGRLHEAIEHRQRFIATEPLFASNHFLYAQLLTAAGRLDEAEKSIRFGQQLEQQPSRPSYLLLYPALLRGDEKAALDIARQQQQPRWREMNLALAAQIGSDRAAADAALAKLLDDKTWTDTSTYTMAQIYALRGDAEQTVAWLERTWAARDTNIHRLLYDPLLLRFRREPRLIAFCRRIGLPPPDESEALDIDRIRAELARTAANRAGGDPASAK